MKHNGFELVLKTAVSSNVHLHDGIECILVLQGEAAVVTEGISCQLRNDDLVVINKNQVHTLASQPGSLILVLSVDNQKLKTECGPLADNIIECSPLTQDTSGKDEIYFELKRTMVGMFSVGLQQPYGDVLTLNMNLLRFLHLLYTSYSQQPMTIAPAEPERKAEINDILMYIEQNYKESLSLNEIADHFYMSAAHFSRFFKKATGKGYLQYLQNLRVEKSRAHLLHSSDSILEVALEYGFSSARSYTNCFQKRYKETPGSYRKTHAAAAGYEEHEEELVLLSGGNSEDIQMEFRRHLGRYELDVPAAATQKSHAEFSVADQSISQHQAKETLLLIDEPAYALRADFSVVSEMKEQINAKYVYFQLPLYQSGHEKISGLYLEELIMAVERIHRYGLIPFIRVAFSPSLFTGMDEDILAYTQTVLSAILDTLSLRFSAEQTDAWHFELVCSNFSYAQGQRFYVNAYQVIRRFFRQSPVGLFAETEEDKSIGSNFKRLLLYGVRTGRAPQFVTFHSFQNQIKKHYPKDTRFFTGAAEYHVNTARIVEAVCHEAGLQVPLYLTAWNTLSGENAGEINMYVRTGIIWDALLRLGDHISGIGYRLASRETCPYSGECPGTPLDLMVFSGTKRPVYFVADFFNRMAGDVIFHSEYTFAVKTYNGELLVALWNVQMLNPAHVIDTSLTESLAKEMRVCIGGLENREYQIKRFTVDGDSNGVTTQMMRSGYPDWRDKDAMRYISETTIGNLIVSRTEVKGNTLRLSPVVQYNGMVLYIIKM